VRHPAVLSVGAMLLAGCALKGDVRRVELQVAAVRDDVQSLDAARRAQLDSLLAVVAQVQQALVAQQAYLVRMRGDLRTDLLSVQQQIVTVQELTGQSEQRLSELRSKIEARAQQPVPGVEVPPAPGAPASPGTPGAPGVQPPGSAAAPAGPGPDEMFDLSMEQYRRGSLGTARLGFREFLTQFPTDERAADALYHVGETFEDENPDSADAVYEEVVKSYPNSLQAASALYKLGLAAEARGQKAVARTYYQRIVTSYPRADEANLARDKLQHLGH
jgi:tol-pal system protein YbgF